MNRIFRSKSTPLLQLSPADIHPNPDQPRVHFEDAAPHRAKEPRGLCPHRR